MSLTGALLPQTLKCMFVSDLVGLMQQAIKDIARSNPQPRQCASLLKYGFPMEQFGVRQHCNAISSAACQELPASESRQNQA